MRILIITYSREVNPGTFLQAYGVQYAMQLLYPNAKIELLKHKRLYDFSGKYKDNHNKVLKKDITWLKGKFLAIPRRLKYEWLYTHRFCFTEEEFDFFDYNEKEFKAFAEKYDLVIVGSDTILINLKKNDKFGLMWLLGVNTNKVMFAASAAPANYDLNKEDVDKLRLSLSSFKLLGVRDSVTYKLLHDRIGIEKVISMYDPTYLIPSSYFSLPFWVKLKLNEIRKKKKVVVINFSNGFVYKKQITEYLRLKGYYIISTIYNPWADYNFMTFSPFEWAAMFQNIDLVITERFHDCVFTLRNNKPVVSVDWNKSRFASDGSSKTNDLLSKYGCEFLHYICTCDSEYEVVRNAIDSVEKIFHRESCMKINEEIILNYEKKMELLNF